MITLSSNVQSERRDCIVVCSDLQIAIRANAEEVTSMIDIAGNMYPAGIPVPEVAPGLALGAAAADRLANGWYGYSYVYAAKNRYPYLDAGKAMQGSIAPRGNPAPIAVINVTGGPRRVVVTVTGSDRLDIDQIIIYRTTMWATQAEAELAANSSQMFSIALLDNVLPTQNYNDDALLPTANEQIEYDNMFAPTMEYLAYEAPFLWGIGNDVLIKAVSWGGNTVTLNDEGKWFEGRNGQLATITGITSGGIDGRGTFIFKAGDAAGNNINTAAILTIDGTTPEVLTPATGTGYIKITGPATTLYRSKARNPLSWGETIFIGTSRDPKLFARRVAAGRATGIAIVPGGEYLKLDFKDPSKCYTFSLRAAGTPNFEATRREISDTSVSHHFSQFVASNQDGQKVLWGWDIDNHAILECDGNTQRIVSQSVFETLSNAQSETIRAQYVQGFCNEELELNILHIPWGESINATDLAIFQHYPSGKWGTALIGDMLSTCSIRDPLTNLLRYLGGRDSGVLVEHQQSDVFINHLSGIFDILSFSDINNTINVTVGAFLQEYTGLWGLWYSNQDQRIKIGQILSINTDTVLNETVLEFERVLTIGSDSQTYLDVVSLNGTDPKFLLGQIPSFLEKVIELGNPVSLKSLEGISVSGVIEPLDLGAGENFGVIRLYLYSPNFEEIERLPKTVLDPHFDDVTENKGSYRFNQVATPDHGKLSLQIAPLFFDQLQLRTINLDIR